MINWLTWKTKRDGLNAELRDRFSEFRIQSISVIAKFALILYTTVDCDSPQWWIDFSRHTSYTLFWKTTLTDKFPG